MTAMLEAADQRLSGKELVKQCVDLLGQQIWCWGCDILREEGNWLLETGFDRTPAPAGRDNCSSVYTLELSAGRHVVLRGFGMLYSDDCLGGVFLPRYEFQPRYTTQAVLDRPPWSAAELPTLNAPNQSQREACALMTLAAMEWLHRYEETVAERLGTEYRQAVLEKWNNGKRPIVPAAEMAGAWQSLGDEVAANIDALIPLK